MEENRIKESADVLQELQLVKEMIQKTKQKVVDRGSFFLLWGGLVFLSSSATFVLARLDHKSAEWLPWVILMPIGIIASIFLSRKYSTQAKYKSYVEHSYNSVWLACGIAYFIFMFVDSITSVFSPATAYPVVSFIAGIGVFASGGIMEWTSLKVGGLFWWGGAAVMMMVPLEFHPLILAIVIIPGHLIPGYLLKRQFSRTN